MKDLESAPVTSAQITHQLGEMTGILRMTVNGLESVKQTVERLAERAAFKGDVEFVRAENREALEAEREKFRAELQSHNEKLEKVSSKVDGLNRWMWICTGAGSVIMVVFQLLKPTLAIVLGQ